jgi:hypothetical protein
MNNHKKTGSIGSVLVGAAIGAAAVSLMHKPTRKKLKDKLMTALDKGDAKLDELGEKAATLKDNVKAKAVKELSKTKKKLEETASKV